ncbi:MAG: hypothetical protein ACR2PZ_14520 [Pseudomonadales bacterium]
MVALDLRRRPDARFAGKVVGGAGPVLAGFIIDLAGIEPGSTPASVDPLAIERFGWAYRW